VPYYELKHKRVKRVGSFPYGMAILRPTFTTNLSSSRQTTMKSIYNSIGGNASITAGCADNTSSAY